MHIFFRPTRKAFTLIELLVVISIIAVVASMIFSALAGARKKGNEVASVNNLRQWATALQSSIGENNGHMPSDGITGEGAEGSFNLKDTAAWFNVLPQYMKERALSNEEYKTRAPQPPDRSIWVNLAVTKEEALKYIQPPEKFFFCYAMNSYLSNAAEPTQPANRIVSFSGTVFLAEKGDDKPDCTIETVKAYYGDGKPESDKDNSAHFLFCDGHVELIKRKDFDPSIKTFTADNPSPSDAKNLNPHFTFIPYPDAEK